MKHTIAIEIEVEVFFTPNPGYAQTHWEPGEPAHIEDLDFDKEKVLEAVWSELERGETEEELLDFAEQERKDSYEEKCEYEYEHHMDKIKGDR